MAHAHGLRHLRKIAACQIQLVGLDALVDAAHQLLTLRIVRQVDGDAASGQRLVVQANAVRALRGQQHAGAVALLLQALRHHTRNVQHLNVRVSLLQALVPGVRGIAGNGYGHGTHSVQFVHARAHHRERVLRGFGCQQSSAAIGDRQLRQPVLRIGLVDHGGAAGFQLLGAGLYEQAHKIRPCCRAHAAQNAYRLRCHAFPLFHKKWPVAGPWSSASCYCDQIAGLSLCAARLSCSSLFIGRPRAWFLGGIGCMNHLS